MLEPNNLSPPVTSQRNTIFKRRFCRYQIPLASHTSSFLDPMTQPVQAVDSEAILALYHDFRDSHFFANQSAHQFAAQSDPRRAQASSALIQNSSFEACRFPENGGLSDRPSSAVRLLGLL
jgi:hypothetical protein